MPSTRSDASPASLLKRIRLGRTAVRPVSMVASYAVLALVHALLFFVLARTLGSHEFGTVTSVVALTAILVPFCGLGLATVATMRVARREAGPRQVIGNGLLLSTLTAAAGIPLAMWMAGSFLGGQGVVLLALLFGISEILLTKFVDLAAGLFAGLERQFVSVGFYGLQMLVRLGCAGVLALAVAEPTALDWARLHLAGTALSALLVVGICLRSFGWPRVDRAMALRDTRAGLPFSFVQSARSVYTDVDKAVLAREVSAATTGAFTAAFRLVHLACLPVTANVHLLQARVFRHGGRSGIAGSLGALRLPILLAGGYCLLAGAAIYFTGPLIPWLLGPSYAASAEMFQALCLLPFLLAMQSLASEALAGADAQVHLGWLHATTAGLALVLNLTLVPRLGWQGSVLAAYGAQAFLVVALAGAIVITLRAQRRASQQGHGYEPTA